MAIVQGIMLHASELTWNGKTGVEGEYQKAITTGTLLSCTRRPPSTELGQTPLAPASASPSRRNPAPQASGSRATSEQSDGTSPPLGGASDESSFEAREMPLPDATTTSYWGMLR